MNQQGNAVNNKYKTMLCRHYDTTKGCQMGDKCRFAHGSAELRNMDDPLSSQIQSNPYMQSMIGMGIPSSMNYKSMKCYYFEKDKYCKYGNGCQFAHSDKELRSVEEISYLSSIATAMNQELNSGYSDSYSVEQQNWMNQMNQMNYMNYMNQMNQNQMNPMNYNQNMNNYYDESYTPDTNYGTTGTTENQSNQNDPNAQYPYDPNNYK